MDTMPLGHRAIRPRAPALRRDDRGSVAIEFALAVPMIVLILLTLTQVFSWGMGYLAAQAAADHALQTTRVVGGTEQAGTTDATALLDQLGGKFIAGPGVRVTRGEETTTVRVWGSAHGLPLPIEVTVQAPTERYTTP
jgi:Flp pilus assembly protein TadG